MAATEQLVIKPRKFWRGLKLGPPNPVAARPIEDMPAPKRLFVPLKQHCGALCETRVAAGDKVKMGQVLGESSDPLAAPVHAPVSGEVVSLEELPDPMGEMTLTVIIDNDEADEWLEAPAPDQDFEQKDALAMIKAVRQAGVVEAVTGRPVHTMLYPAERSEEHKFLVGASGRKPVQVFIVNALDADPALACNRAVLMTQPEELGLGADLVKKIVGVRNTVIAAADDSGKSAPQVQGLNPMTIKNRYPVAWPEMLTTAVTGREVPLPDGEPQDVGVLVMDANAVLGLLEAIRSGRPQIERIITVSGPEITTRNLRVRLGAPIKDVIEFAGGSLDKAAKVVAGGLMDGAALYSERTPVTKQTRALTVLGPDGLVTYSEHLCIKCGRCVEVCPVRLLPNVITNFCEFGLFPEAEEAELFKCIECGCCAYVCPAKRPLVQYIVHGKAEIAALREAEAAALREEQ